MMKIGLYLQNENIKEVDLSKPEKGNPGIGGTPFLFVTLPYYFSLDYPGEVDFKLYANSVSQLPENIKNEEVSECVEALERASRDKVDLLIWRPTDDEEGRKFLEKVDTYDIKVICWVHNTPDKLIDKIALKRNIARFVCVSHEQLDRIRDHNIFYKSTYIFNGFDSRRYVPVEEVKKNSDVTYIGSLIPAKGFHILARIWPEVKKRYPFARLNVIGSGKLYNRGSKLGKWGIAEEGYEKKFRKYLSDKEGNIIEGVNFLGVMGNEKIPIMQKSCIGIVNPSGATENCPGSAIEFQACGTPVVSASKWGLLDTVKHKKTGLLGNSDRELIGSILYLLENKEISKQYGLNGINFVNKNFSHQKVNRQWKKLFEEVCGNQKNKVVPMKKNIFYQFKFIKECMRLLKKNIIIFNKVPAIFQFKYIIRDKLFK